MANGVVWSDVISEKPGPWILVAERELPRLQEDGTLDYDHSELWGWFIPAFG